MNRLNKALVITVIAISLSTISFAQSGYKYSQKIPLAGNGYWDYLQIDEGDNRLFVTHDDRVHVIGLKNNKELAMINNLHGAHHITLVPSANEGFVSNGKNNTISVFNYTTLDSITTIKIADENPDPMCYDSFSKKLYVFCDNDTAVVIDPFINKITGTIALGGGPDFALATGKGFIYNNLEGKDETIVIDVVKQKVIKRFPLPQHAAPTGLAYDEKNDRLFIVCRGLNKLSVLNANTGTIISQLPIEANVDGVYFDNETKNIFCSGGSGKITVIEQTSKDSYKVIESIVTRAGARTMELNHAKHELYFSAADFIRGTKTLVPNTFGIFIFKANR